MNKSKNFLQNLIKPFKSHSSKDSQSEAEIQRIAAHEQKFFPFELLVTATKDFHASNKLGQGGFGPVYKGKLSDGREIAVKKLSHTSNQGKKEFKNEANLLARVQHKNVVNLLGFCVHGVEKLLVYEYVAHESLDKLLFKSSKEVLDWKKRYNIICGVARGLLYLHEDSHKCIIHRDIKASNILLDDKWVPKIADFGMARLFPEDETHVNTRVAGTNGYMAPEYVVHGHLSVKADVFSYGVVVLELISGQRNSSFNPTGDAQNLLDWAYKLYKRGKSLEFMDTRLVPTAVAEQVVMCIQIGLLCTQGDMDLRPTMHRVVVILSRNTTNLEEPTRPGMPGSRYRRTRRPGGPSLSTAGTYTESDSNAFDSSATGTTSRSVGNPRSNFSSNSRHRTTTMRSNFSTGSASGGTTYRSARSDAKGKQPMM